MGTGYTRNDTLNNIADGNVINASDLDGEFDAVESAFNETTGHTHDGTAAEGAPITVLGPVQDFIASATEIKPKTTNTLDIGTNSLQFKDMYLDGTAYLDDIQAVGAVDITGDLDVDNININGNSISSTDTNGNITLAPNGTGVVALSSTDLTFGDNDKAIFGAGSDLQIFHDGSNSRIAEAGTGDLKIGTSGGAVRITANGVADDMIVANQGSSVTLAHSGNVKLTTTATGVDVTGIITTDGMTTSADVNFGDNDSAIFGAGNDLTINHDGNNSFITDSGTGSLYIQGTSGVFIRSADGGETLAAFTDDGAATLYYDNSAKIATTATGVDVSSTDATVNFVSSRGTGATHTITTGGANSLNFNINAASGGDIYVNAENKIFRSAAGSTEHMRIDSSGAVIINNSGGDAQLYMGGTSGTSRMYLARSGSDSLLWNVSNGNMRFGTNNAESMRIDSSGNVGIGTSSPTFLTGSGLEVSRSGSATVRVERTGATASAGEFFAGNDKVVLGTATNTHLQFRTNNTERMRIDTSGNVGINRTPSYELDVGGNDNAGCAVRIIAGSDSGADAILRIQCTATAGTRDSAIYFGDSANTAIGRITYGHENDDFRFFTNNTEKMRIDSSGKVGIGTTPGFQLDVRGNVAANYLAYFFNDGNNANRYGVLIQSGADSGSGTLIGFNDGDGTGVGGITFSGGTVTYGAFTAQHPCIIPDADNDPDSDSPAYPYGTLLETTSLSYIPKSDGTDSERGIRYHVRKTQTANSKAVLGAYGCSMNGGPENQTNEHQALVLGDGHILCNNSGGNIEIGDGICSSAVAGIGQKATASPSMIIGIAQEAVTFSSDTETKLVAVQYGLQQFTPW